MPTSQRHDDTRSMWWTAIAMYATGAATLFAILPLPDPDPSDHGALTALAAIHLALAAGLWLAGPRRRLLEFSPAVGIVGVSVVVAVADPVGAAPFFYLWPVLAAAYHLTPRGLNLVLLVFYAGYGGGLLLTDEPDTSVMLFVGGALCFSLAGLVVNRLRRRLDQTMAELRRTAATDPLTALLNRRGFERAFDRDVERARRTGAPLTLVIIDLDHFKRVNDRFGHAAGDDVLRTFAGILLDERRGGDVVGRTGGEEFAIVLTDADAEGALEYVGRVAADQRLAEGPAGPMSLSAGIAELGGALLTRDDLMLAADAVLYEAKAAGRGRAMVHGAADAAGRRLAA